VAIHPERAMEKILVIGAGLLGSRIVEQAKGEYEVHAADADASLSDVGCQFHKLDITEKQSVVDLLYKVKPKAVFHTAALTNVDKCETEPTLARKVNGSACGHIALACAKLEAYVCAISTDYVFNGKTGMYKEDSKVSPICEYGRSKLMGEDEIKCLGSRWKWTILRSSILYGAYRKRFNFVTWIIDELRAARPVRIVTDQFGSPTLADDLADACLALWKKGATGIYHAAGSERISRYAFALKICDVFSLDKGLVTAITTDELKQRAMRPPDSSLDVTKVESALGRKMLDIVGGLAKVKEKEKDAVGPEKKPMTRTI
jgi:dTDP-4-dehydrorhamnose reductase